MATIQEMTQEQTQATSQVSAPSELIPLDARSGYYFTKAIVIADTAAATAANYGVFFTAPFACEVIEAWETHKTAGSNGSAVTLDIEKLTSAQALDAGVSVLAATFNLKATADTPTRSLCSTTKANRTLNPGNRIALKDAGTLTAVAHVEVTVLLKAVNYHLSTVNTP